MKVTIDIDIKTEATREQIGIAIIKGIYWGLDVKNVAPPANVKVNDIDFKP